MANLIETLNEEGIFTTFIRAIKMTEIVATLREPGAYTMFAPTDADFAQMKADGYVVRDTITSTLLESIKVNGAHITRANISADNGVIHVIDKVLVPHFMIL